MPSVTQPDFFLLNFLNLGTSQPTRHNQNKMDDSLPALKILMIGPSGAGKSACMGVLVYVKMTGC